MMPIFARELLFFACILYRQFLNNIDVKGFFDGQGTKELFV